MAFVVSELSLSQQSLCCWWALGEEATLGGRAGDGAACVRLQPSACCGYAACFRCAPGRRRAWWRMPRGETALRLCCAAVSELVTSLLLLTAQIIIN